MKHISRCVELDQFNARIFETLFKSSRISSWEEIEQLEAYALFNYSSSLPTLFSLLTRVSSLWVSKTNNPWALSPLSISILSHFLLSLIHFDPPDRVKAPSFSPPHMNCREKRKWYKESTNSDVLFVTKSKRRTVGTTSISSWPVSDSVMSRLVELSSGDQLKQLVDRLTNGGTIKIRQKCFTSQRSWKSNLNKLSDAGTGLISIQGNAVTVSKTWLYKTSACGSSRVCLVQFAVPNNLFPGKVPTETIDIYGFPAENPLYIFYFERSHHQL